MNDSQTVVKELTNPEDATCYTLDPGSPWGVVNGYNNTNAVAILYPDLDCKGTWRRVPPGGELFPTQPHERVRTVSFLTAG
ncbi:hypothetical protein AB0399_16665 [Streptomyces sp. NPDC088194]|uniref:hypothetical protein n=1 Tax=Streptomyces sp. NPDC088194 TaxID=3154931 RepID=UPI00344B324C